MTIDTGNLLEPTNTRKPGDFLRNRQGAPYVTHPTEMKKDGTPKRVVYGRPSSFGTALDSAYNLIKWKERQLLIGAHLLEGRAFQMMVASDLMDVDPADRDALDRLAARCHQAAGSSLAADRGTHIHLLLEHIDRGGEPLRDLIPIGVDLGIPAELQSHIINQWLTFRAELGVTALAIEATVVHDAWRLAGTLDRHDLAAKDILTGFGIIAAGQSFIGDIKTGGLTLGRDGQPNYWVKFPVQVVGYRDGVPYDVETDTRGDWGEHVPHPDIALIYHYDLAAALEGVATDWQAIPVNLAAGREGGNLCRWAADFGRRRDLFLMPAPKEREPCADTTLNGLPTNTTLDLTSTPSTSTSPAPTTDVPASTSTSLTTTNSSSTGPVVDVFHIVVSDGRRGSVTVPTSRTWIREKIRELATAGHEPEIRQQWPQGVPPLTDTSHTVEQLTQLFHMVRRVEAEVGAPFDPVSAPYEFPGVPQLKDITESLLEPLDDGAFLDPPEIEALKARMLALPDTRHIQLADISREANAAGRPISVTAKPCVRRWEIARALILWAETPDDLHVLFAYVVHVATQEQVRDNDTLGAVLSQFTIEQACQLADLFQPQPEI